MRSNFTCYGELRRFVRLIGKVRIIAANVRTAAVCLCAGDFARISRTPLDAGYGRLCIVGGGFRLDAQQFHLLRRAKPLHLKVSTSFAIPRLT